MAISYELLSFASTLRYMRKFQDYTLPSGGGTITHGLGYPPYFSVFAKPATTGYLIPIQTGNVAFPSDFPGYLIQATNTTITITEDIAPLDSTTYYVRVYEDPLP